MVFKKAGWPWPLHTVCHQRTSTRTVSDKLKTVFETGFDSLILQLFSDDYLKQQYEKKEKLELD